MSYKLIFLKNNIDIFIIIILNFNCFNIEYVKQINTIDTINNRSVFVF